MRKSVIAATCVLVGCGGSAFTAADFAVDSGPPDVVHAAEATPEAAQQVEDGGTDARGDAVVRTAHDGGDGGSTAEVEAEAEAGPTCVTDLSGVGAGSFQISFTIVTTASGRTYSLINQRAGCDTSSAWWAVTLTPSGGIELATDDGSGASYVFVQSGAAVNDGLPHTVVAARMNGSIWLSRDGVVDSVMTPDVYSFGALPPLTLGSSGCSSETPLTGHGTLENVCIVRP